METKEMKELLNKLKAAKSAQELIELAKAEGKELPADEAEKMFAELNAEGEISEEELEAIAGGFIRSIFMKPVHFFA